jgi:hypothetical protein
VLTRLSSNRTDMCRTELKMPKHPAPAAELYAGFSQQPKCRRDRDDGSRTGVALRATDRGGGVREQVTRWRSTLTSQAEPSRSIAKQRLTMIR